MNGHILGSVARVPPSDGSSGSVLVSIDILDLQSDGYCPADSLRTGEFRRSLEHLSLPVVSLSVFAGGRSSTSVPREHVRRFSRHRLTDMRPADAARCGGRRRPHARPAEQPLAQRLNLCSRTRGNESGQPWEERGGISASPLRLPHLPPLRLVGARAFALRLQVPESPLPTDPGVLRGVAQTVPAVFLLAGSAARDAPAGGLRLPAADGELAEVLLPRREGSTLRHEADYRRVGRETGLF